ncbi:MAG: transposase [Anaeromyxobacter sp.]
MVAGARDELLRLLGHYKERYGILIRSYCLMGNHQHVGLTTTRGLQAFSRFWQCVNKQFADSINQQTGRKGQVIMERMRSPRMDNDEGHVVRVMRYIDQNPVEAELVRSAKDWRYSSHRHYALGEPDPLLDDPPEYLALGRTPIERRKAYRALFAQPLEEEAHPPAGDAAEPASGDVAPRTPKKGEGGDPPPDSS